MTYGNIIIVSLCISGEFPSLPDLLQLQIPQVVGVNYERFGVLLLKDTTGSQVDIIVHDAREKTETIVRSILKEWLKGKGKPVTWQTLIDTLRDCKHTDLADKIQYSIRST